MAVGHQELSILAASGGMAVGYQELWNCDVQLWILAASGGMAVGHQEL